MINILNLYLKSLLGKVLDALIVVCKYMVKKIALGGHTKSKYNRYDKFCLVTWHNVVDKMIWLTMCDSWAYSYISLISLKESSNCLNAEIFEVSELCIIYVSLNCVYIGIIKAHFKLILSLRWLKFGLSAGKYLSSKYT